MVLLLGTGVSPDGLVSQPARIALVEAILVGSLQLLGCGDDGAVLQAGPLCSVKVQRVACGDGSVVEHDTWGHTDRSGVRCELWFLKR